MKNPGILDLDTRKKIFEYVQSHPGCHFRAIYRDMKLPTGVVSYHLKYLENKEMMVSKKSAGYRRYYIRDAIKKEDKKLFALLRQKNPREIIMFVLLNPGASHGDIQKEFDISAATFSYHMKKLVKAEIVTFERIGRNKLYHVKNADQVAKALVTHKKSFTDELVESFEDAWMDIHV